MKSKIRWGILGTGTIANKFAHDLLEMDDAVVSAVGSRRKPTAVEFGEKYGIPAERCFGSYEELYASKDVDILYIASPHSHHAEHMLPAIEEGKHILCEKSFTLNTAQAREVFEAAKKRGVYVAEGMWTRFLPANVELMKRINSGELGELTTSWAFFGAHFPDEWPLTHRIYNPELGGGALLDMGVYAVSYISMLARDAEPESVVSAGKLFAPTGVDGQVMITLSYPGELMSVAGTAIKSAMKAEAFVTGTKGRAVIPEYWNAESFEIIAGGKAEEVSFPKDAGRFTYEAGAVMDDIRAGRTESEIIPHSATLTVLNILETARKNLGFYYACEK